MAEVDCIRCKQRGSEIERVTYGGAIGAELKATICNNCWVAWYDQSVKIINEYRLNLRDAPARAFLSEQMKIFLGMIPAPEGPTAAPPIPQK